MDDGSVDHQCIYHLPFPPALRSPSFLHRASYMSRTLSSDILLSHPPPLTNLKAPPLSFWDISVANDLQRQGRPQLHQTLPAVEQLYRDLKKEAIGGFPFPLKILSAFFLPHYLFFNNHLNVLGFEKLVRALSNDIGACLTT